MVARRRLRRWPALASALAAAFALAAAPAARAQAPDAGEPTEPAVPASTEPPAPPPALVPHEAPQAKPRLHHAPVSSARPGVPLEIGATIDHANSVRGANVVYRRPDGSLRAVPFLRGVSEYVALIPAEDMRAPGLAYTIEVETVDGARASLFASRAAMHPVSVVEDRADARERAQLARLGGRRSVVTASAEYVRFGTTTGSRAVPCGPNQPGCPEGELRVPSVDDQYWRAEVGYTYRILRTVAEFTLRGGVVRGTSLVPLGQIDLERYKVGLNYGAPSVRFRLHDAWHLETELLTSITDTGFSVGAGGALLIGDPYGGRLVLGAQVIGLEPATYFGSRFYTRLDVMVSDTVRVAPMVEVTDMPRAEEYGVRLLGEAAIALGGGFELALRGGYQARRAVSGGPSVGGQMSYAF